MDATLTLQPGQPPLATFSCYEEREGVLAGITLVTGRRSYIYRRMHALIVALALAGPVRVLIGGNRYDHYGINYALAAATSDYEYLLDQHISLSRAETCYQMIELLTRSQADGVAYLVLDLLATFYDEAVPEREINQLLFESILQLRRLSRGAVVVVSAYPEEKRPQLLKGIENAVDRVEGPQVSSLIPAAQQRLAW